MKPTVGHPFAVCLLLGLLLIVVVRLPQLSPDRVVLDGDEAVLGLMARHAAAGRVLPLFFYGQSYGLSVFEAGVAGAFFRLFGPSATALKVATLMLWCTGWLFFALAVRRLSGRTVACWAAVLLALAPAWGAWSMMARGGYVTAFSLTGFCFWVLVCIRGSGHRRTARAFLLGAGLGLLGLAQVIWLLAFAPLAAVLLWERRRAGETLVLLLGAAASAGGVFLLTLATGGLSTYWEPQIFRDPDLWHSLVAIPERMWVHLSGAYYYASRTESGPFTTAAALGWCLAFLIAGGLLIQRLCRGGRTGASDGEHSRMAGAVFVAMLLVLAASVPMRMDGFNYRYFLPLAAYLTLYLSIELPRHLAGSDRARVFILPLLVLIALSSAGALVETGRFARSGTLAEASAANHAARRALISELETNGVGHAYCLHPTFQWNLIFESGEKVIARWMDPVDRVPDYPLAVDRALHEGRPVAVVGTRDHLRSVREFLNRTGFEDIQIRVVGDRYFWIANPGVDLVRRLGFRLNRP